MDSVRRASGTLTSDGISTAAQSLGINESLDMGQMSQQKSAAKPAATLPGRMLPTPAKTPKKQTDEKTEVGIQKIARNLFPSDTDAIRSSTRKKKKYSGLTLDSFTAEDIESPIKIFTDSHERIPELDTSEENPFYNATASAIAPAAPACAPEAPKRRSPRQKTVTIPGEGEVPIDDAVSRSDGIVYVFRGKKLWKPITDDVVDPEDSSSSNRVTRSSLQPRLLFPASQAGLDGNATDDEEAATDIEDSCAARSVRQGGRQDSVMKMAGLEAPHDKTPRGEKLVPATPKAPRYAPASPPTSARATRVVKKDDTPVKKPAKARSPFDGWRRSKSSASTLGQKREGDPLPEESGSKRLRA